jgi:hypothetical protein
MLKEPSQIRTCFVAAPAGIPLDTLRESLLAHDIHPLVPHDLSPGSSWPSEIQRQMVEADLVVGILPKGKQSNWVLFELGQAWALGRRILLIASPKVTDVPFDFQRFLVLRTEPDNREAIDFALDQLVSAPAALPRAAEKLPFAGKELGNEVDPLFDQVELALESKDYKRFESIVASAIRRSGTDVVVESPELDRGADLAVWSDVLEPFVGNPLLIEVRLKVGDRKTADTMLRRLSALVPAAAAKWAVLIYGEGPAPEDKFWKSCPPNILILPIRTLLASLRGRAFPEVVRDLRNRRVHSVRP